MGWTFTSGATRASTIATLLSDPYHKTIAHALRSNVLWAVKEYVRQDTPVRYIACFPLKGDQHEYGYKDLRESMGPAEVSFISLTSFPSPTVRTVPRGESVFGHGTRANEHNIDT